MSWKESPNFMAIKFIIIWGFLEKKWKKISEMYTFEMTSLLLSNTESNLKKQTSLLMCSFQSMLL